MENFDLKDVLDAVGPTASIVFASWIFLSLLQQRYTSAYERYRELIDNYRHGLEGERKGAVSQQVRLYKLRLRYMRYSTNIGLVAAILLIFALIMGALESIAGGDIVKYTGAVCILVGLLLVIVAAVLVVVENLLITTAIDSELADIPDLRDG